MFDSNSIIIWAAGLFEGEGTISINKHGIRVAVTMTDLDVLETFKTNFGGSLLEQKSRKEHYKKQWRWNLTNSKDTYDFLKVILPYLHKRRCDRTKRAISTYEKTLVKREENSKRIRVLRDSIRELGKLGLIHKDIAIKLNVDRSYVTHTLNGDYD